MAAASEPLTKDDLPFLVEAMDKGGYIPVDNFIGVGADAEEGKDTIKGEMNIPKPVEVNVNGTMSKEDYKKCSTIMAVCQNMVQKTITDAAAKAGVKAADALKNMDAWVEGYVNFPFPFFNFKDTSSDDYKQSDFSLNADPEVVASIVNIKNVPELKDAVLDALKKSGGDIATYSDKDRDFNYFGVITAYNDTNISIRVVKFQLKMKTTNAKALCVTYEKTNLDTKYQTYQFVGDAEMMIKMQDKMGDQLIDYFAKKLLEFAEAFYDQQFKDFKDKIEGVLKNVFKG